MPVFSRKRLERLERLELLVGQLAVRLSKAI